MYTFRILTFKKSLIKDRRRGKERMYIYIKIQNGKKKKIHQR